MDYLDCAKTSIDDLKITATDDQIEQLAQYFEQAVENEIHVTDFVPITKDKCRCEYYKGEIDRLENVIRIYNKSVKDRRNCNSVWVNTQTDTVQYD